MMAQLIDRKQLKQQMKDLLRSAQVGARGMTLLYLALVCALNLTDSLTGLVNDGLPAMFVSILTSLLGMVLSAGFVLYCMAVRRCERAEYLTLFDGFSFVGRIILLNIVEYLFIFLWSLLFVIPGIIAAYRYRFALYDLYENPGIGVMEALEMSKQQTLGYKGQLFLLDLSYTGWYLLASLPSLIQVGYIYAFCRTRAISWRTPPGSTPSPCRSPSRSRCCWAACGPWRWRCSISRSTSARSWGTSTSPSTPPA